MPETTTTNQYVEIRNGAYYLAGTRVSLASVIYSFKQGASPEVILQDFPAIGSVSKVCGAIAFIIENPAIVDAYLAEQVRLWSELEVQHPLPPDMAARFE
jgi:uncharacterized protein (DUF433 family)